MTVTASVRVLAISRLNASADFQSPYFLRKSARQVCMVSTLILLTKRLRRTPYFGGVGADCF
jgi:hypothetical protein